MAEFLGDHGRKRGGHTEKRVLSVGMVASAKTRTGRVEILLLSCAAAWCVGRQGVGMMGGGCMMVFLALVTCFWQEGGNISDSRLRRCRDNVGLGCGCVLPVAMACTVGTEWRFAAICCSANVLSCAWRQRVDAGSWFVGMIVYACAACGMIAASNWGMVGHALVGGAVGVFQRGLLSGCRRTFTVAESGLVAWGMVIVLQLALRRMGTEASCGDDAQGMTEAALLGSVLVWWCGVVDGVYAAKAGRFRRLGLLFAALGSAYAFAWWRGVGCEPVAWMVHFILRRRARWGIVVAWAFSLGWVVLFVRPGQSKVSKSVARKFYHALAMAIFGGGAWCDVQLTAFASAVALGALVIGEMLRVAGTRAMRDIIEAVAGGLLDDRDGGPVVVTHLYLLLGCAAPFWAAPDPVVARGGLITLCVMDAVAAAVGTRYGRTRWPANTRTVEGTIAGVVVAGAVACALGGPWRIICVATAFAGALECVTDQIDNLVLPALYCAVVAPSP